VDDTHFQDGAVTMLFSVLPKKAASMLVMDSSDQVTFLLQDIQDKKSLTLHFRIFPGWGREHDSINLDWEASQYLVYESLQPFTPWVTQDTQPKIVDALWTLIFRMGQ
jgi:hypothetical protein